MSEDLTRSRLNFIKARPGACPECNADHHVSQAHRWGSDFYMNGFFDKHGVYPTWGDALAHCREDVRMNWEQVLLAQGVTADEMIPAKPQPPTLEIQP